MRSPKLQRLTLEVDTVKSHGLGRLINTPVKIKACWNKKLLLKILSFMEMERNTIGSFSSMYSKISLEESNYLLIIA